MTPKLYYFSASPPSRAVLICAKALDIKLELISVNLSEKEHLKDNYLKKNPQHTVPVLEDEDFIVSDSHAIMGYLVAKYGKNDALYPNGDYKQRARIDHMLHFDSGILFARGINATKPLLQHDIQPTQDKFDDLRDAYQILDKILDNNNTNYVAGNSLSIADFSIFTSVTSWTVYLPYSDFPNIKAYVERMQKISCFEEDKERLAMTRAIIGSKLEK